MQTKGFATSRLRQRSKSKHLRNLIIGKLPAMLKDSSSNRGRRGTHLEPEPRQVAGNAEGGA
jgi:hypothetical protein